MMIDKKNKPVAVEKPTEKKNLTHVDSGNELPTSVGNNGSQQKMPVEINGPKGLEPTRFGDWEQKGRCTDF